MAKEGVTMTSGIPLKVFYTPEDMKGLDYNRDLGNTGEPPYTRGIYPQMYRFQPWMMLQLAGFETMERTRDRMEMMFREGHWSMRSAVAMPLKPRFSTAVKRPPST